MGLLNLNKTAGIRIYKDLASGMKLMIDKVTYHVNSSKEDLADSITLKTESKPEAADYEIITNDDGSKSLKRFNNKSNMWIKLDFSEKAGDSLTNVIAALKDNFLEKRNLL